jgi:hypothetical protein
MTITITSITKKQWKSIGSVALWLFGSGLVSAALVYVTRDAKLAAPLLAAINLVGFSVTQFFKQETTKAEDELPTALRVPVVQAAQAATDEVISKILPVPATPIEPAYSPTSAPTNPVPTPATKITVQTIEDAVDDIAKAEEKPAIAA